MKKKLIFILAILLFQTLIYSDFNISENNIDTSDSLDNSNKIDRSPKNIIENSTKNNTNFREIDEETTSKIKPQSSSSTAQVDFNQWYDGETVKVETKQNNIYGHDSDSDLSSTSGTETFSGTFEITETFIEDGSYASARCDSDFSDSTCPIINSFDGNFDYEVQRRIYFAVPEETTGDITVVLKGYGDTLLNTGFLELSMYLDTSYRQNNLIKVFTSTQIDIGTSNWGLGIYVYNYVTNQYDAVYTTGTISGTFSTGNNLYVWVDYISFEPDQIISNIPTKYKYSSETQIIHQLEFNLYLSGSTVALYSPLSWNFTSIYPGVKSIQWDDTSKTYNITRADPTYYTLKFLSGEGWGIDYARQKQLLAIRDVSSDYLESQSFESGKNDDWVNHATVPVELISVNTSIVSEGSFSLRLEDTDASTDYLSFSNLDPGQYYLSFDYYVESYSNTLWFEWASSSSTSTTQIDVTSLNRWNKAFLYFEFNDATYDFIRLFFSSSSYVMFIDNIFIGVASGRATNIGYSQTEFDATFLSWDGLQNPILANEQVEFSLRDRTADTEIFSKTLTTDVNGVASYIFQGSLEQKEYAQNWWSWESTFYSDSNYQFDTYSETSSNYGDVLTKTTDTAIYGDYSVLTTSTTQAYDPQIIFTVFDASLLAGITIWMKTNKTINWADIQWRTSGASNYFTTDISDISTSTSYAKYNFQFQNPSSTYGDEQYVKNNLNYLYLRTTTGSSWSQNFDGLAFVQFQSSYFTPTSSLSYSYQTKQNLEQNYFDYSESTLEGWAFVGNTGAEEFKVENGYMLIAEDADGGTPRISGSNLGTIDTSFYDKIIIRIYSNSSKSIFLRTYALTTLSSTYSINTGWNILEITPNSLWVGDYSDGLAFRINGVNNQIKIDYIKIIHSEYSNGYSYEFEEPETLSSSTEKGSNGWYMDQTSSNVVDVNQGYVHSESTATYRGIETILEYQDTWNNYEIRLLAKSDASSNIWVSTRDSTNTIITGTSIILTTKWVEYSISLSLASNLAYLRIEDNNVATAEFDIAYIRFIDTSTASNLYETDNSFVFSSKNDTSVYYYENDEFSGYATDLQELSKNMSVGVHSFSYTRIYDASIDENLLQLASVWYSYTYTIAESGLSFISIVDQQNNFLDPRSFIIEVDSNRIYSDAFYRSDTSSTYNFTISDFWGNVLYQDLTQSYSQFIDLVLTLYSVKIKNEMDIPVYSYITNGPVYSTWILPGEIVEFKLKAASYNFTLQYSTVSSSFAASTLNGTTIEYIYTVNADTALIINDFSIQDVYNNVISLISNLDATNSSIQAAIVNQTNNFTISIDNTNTNINNQTNYIQISITNTNSTLGNQLNTITTDIANLQTNITLQINTISTEISNLQTNITIQYNDLNQVVVNVQTNQTIQYNTLTSLVNNFETSMDSQLNSISVSINNNLSNITLQFNEISTEINNMNSSVTTQFNTLTSLVNNFETSMDSQLNSIVGQITNTNSSMTLQFNSLSSQVNNFEVNMTTQINSLNQTVLNVQTNQTIQYNTLTSLVNNFETSMDSQLNSISVSINNNLSNITLQFNEISSEINNMNSSVATQFNSINTLLNNLNTQIDTQTNNITIQISNNLTNITGQINDVDVSLINLDSQVVNQANTINSNIVNINTTLYLQSVNILNQISNYNTTIYNQTIDILSAISNTNSTLYSQTLSILTQIDLSNSTQVSLLLTNAAEILTAQVYAAEYMSILRLEQIEPTFDLPNYSFYPITNWKNATIYIYQNSSLIYSGNESEIISLLLTSYGRFNITIYINATNLLRVYSFSQSYIINYVVPDAGKEIIIIYVYDLDGFKFSNVPWDLYYNSSLLDSFLLELEINTFNSSLIEFRDLFGNDYPGVLFNQTTSISGYRVFQYQIQAYQISLFNEQIDSDAILSLQQGSNWVNYTLSPGEQKYIWVTNITTGFYASVVTLDEVGIQNNTAIAVGNASIVVTGRTSFGLSQSVRALLNNDDVTINEYVSATEKSKYAIYYVGDWYRIPVDIKITLGQLWGTIIIGLLTIIIGIIRIFIQKNVEVKLDNIYDYKKSRYIPKKRYKLKSKTEWEFQLSGTVKASIVIILFLALFSV